MTNVTPDCKLEQKYYSCIQNIAATIFIMSFPDLWDQIYLGRVQVSYICLDSLGIVGLFTFLVNTGCLIKMGPV